MARGGPGRIRAAPWGGQGVLEHLDDDGGRWIDGRFVGMGGRTRSGAVIATALALLSIPTQGCLTMARGPDQVISVESSPAGATIRVEPGGESGTTPRRLSLRRRTEHLVIVEKDGYEPTAVTLESSSSWGLFRNMVWLHGVVVGLIVDYSTGSAYKLKPDSVFVDLRPVAPVSEGPPPPH